MAVCNRHRVRLYFLCGLVLRSRSLKRYREYLHQPMPIVPGAAEPSLKNRVSPFISTLRLTKSPISLSKTHVIFTEMDGSEVETASETCVVAGTIPKCVCFSRDNMSAITARASSMVAARSSRGRNSSCTACQSRPPSLGSSVYRAL